MSWLLRTSSVPSHSAQVFSASVGSGAIYEMARILTQFHDSLSNDPPLTFNPGVVVGGTTVTFDREENRGTAFGKTNVVAESAYVAGDLRALTPEQFAPTDGNRWLLAMLDEASRAAGLPAVGAVDPARAGAADISFVAGRVGMALDGLGLKGRADHTVNETAELRMLAVQAKRAAVLMGRLAARAVMP